MISFIVIGKNEGWRLDKCLSSIQRFVDAESLRDFEVVYVDSKSTDNSIEIAKSYTVNKVFKITGECNAAIGRNIGAKESSGDILFFLDGDMELIPGFWQEIVDGSGKLKYPFVSGVEKDVLHDNQWNYVVTNIRRAFVEGEDKYCNTTGGLFVITRKLWNQVGGMDNCQKINEDFDLGIRLAKIGYPLCRKGRIWVNHYTRYPSVRNTPVSTVKYSARLARKHIFNWKAQKDQFLSYYSYWILLTVIASALIFQSIIPFLFYLPVTIYRTVQIIRHTNVRLNPIGVYINRVAKDFAFLFYFFFYWPKAIREEYKEV